MNCTDSEVNYEIKKYQDTIIRLKKENDSLKAKNIYLTGELKKCDNWVNILEDNKK